MSTDAHQDPGTEQAITAEELRLPLDRITADQAIQPRTDGLDADHMALLEQNPDGWPPLIVVASGGYQLVDGFHRYAVAQNLGLETIRVEVHKAPDNGDLHALAFALNVSHGRPLTLTDRRAEAERLLRADATISNAQVAERTRLSPTTIAAIRWATTDRGVRHPQAKRRGASSAVNVESPSMCAQGLLEQRHSTHRRTDERVRRGWPP